MLSAPQPQPQLSLRQRSNNRLSSRNQNQSSSNRSLIQHQDEFKFTLTSEDSITGGEITLEGLDDLSSSSSSSPSSPPSSPSARRRNRSSTSETATNNFPSLFVPVTDGRGRIIAKGIARDHLDNSSCNTSSSMKPLNNPKRAETRSLPLNTRKTTTNGSSLRSMTLKTAQAHFARLSNVHQVEIQGLGLSHLIREPQSVVIDSSDEEDSDSSDGEIMKSKGSPKLGSPKLGSPKLGSPKFNSSLRRMPSSLTNASRESNQASTKAPGSPKRCHSRGGWSSHSSLKVNTDSLTSLRRNFARTWSDNNMISLSHGMEDGEEKFKNSSDSFSISNFSTFSDSSEETSDLSTTESEEDSSIESLENLSLSDESDREEEPIFARNERTLNKLSTDSSDSLSSDSSFESNSTSNTSIHSQDNGETAEEEKKVDYQSDSENSLYKGFTNSIFSSSEEESDFEEEEESESESFPSSISVQVPFYGGCSFSSSQYHSEAKHHHSRQLKNRRTSGYYSSDSEDDWEFASSSHSHRNGHDQDDEEDEEFETIILGIGNINDEISQPLSTNLIKPNPRPTSIAEMQSKINLPVIVAPKNVVDRLLAKN